MSDEHTAIPVPFRVGHGFDVHAFMPGDPLVVGGVRIPFDRAFLAHSDGDVLLHALCDALLGAVALGDIGQLFPDSDPAYEGIDSTILLSDVHNRIRALGWQIGNLDMTIIAQLPRMAPHIPVMRQRISEVLALSVDRINIKATTTERLGFTGRGEGIAVESVVLLYR
ncbi:2-C-methyl-D-erythritol 2,4-cyclodiphosphate synthase [Halothiobacillus sp.]|uniref:2-C-methyl-D-erythritol 2,4-cyclodiphosphate synthase n=1 Tax=Halothiobacillus sp. TaxID=1891311 RepID=UPI002AD52653|nr:2-C-methyl-D-erythritol 2,4-cyclodiphosphate synthase [Halothiobacillus sp.]